VKPASVSELGKPKPDPKPLGRCRSARFQGVGVIAREQGEMRLQHNPALRSGDVRFSKEDIKMANPSRSLIAVAAGFLIWETLALVLGNQPNSTKILQLATRGGQPRVVQRDQGIGVHR